MMASPYGPSGGFDPGYGQSWNGFGTSYQEKLNEYYKTAQAAQMFYPPTVTITKSDFDAVKSEVRKALPVVEEFEWLRSRVSEILWKSDKPSSQVRDPLNGAVYCT